MTARIFSIADVFDALTSRRPYKEPMSFHEAIKIMQKGRGSHFDPALLDAFFDIAQDLYSAYSDRDDQRPKARLESMIEDYFKRDVGDLLM